MNSQLQTFQFNNIPVSVIDRNGEGWMAGEDIGLALEYADDPKNSIRKIFERNRNDLEEYSVTVKLTATDGKQYDTRVYNEEGVMMIGFFSKQPKAVAFRQWAVKVLKAYRHQQSSNLGFEPITSPLTLAQFNARQKALDAAQHALNQAQVIVSAADLLAKPTKGRKVKVIAPRKWTPEEVSALHEMRAKGYTYTRIAQQLGRTANGVINRYKLAAAQGGGQ